MVDGYKSHNANDPNALGDRSPKKQSTHLSVAMQDLRENQRYISDQDSHLVFQVSDMNSNL